VAASRRHLRGQDAPATAGKMPALRNDDSAFWFQVGQ
jgi:hypothetical protein